MAALGLVLAAPGVASASTIAAKKSLYWAGYVDTVKPGGARAYKYIATIFRVPAVNCASFTAHGSNQEYFLAALNFGGTDPQEMLGSGVFASCASKSGANYSATISNGGFGFGCYGSDGELRPFAVKPGDTIFASAYYNATTNQFTYKVADQTTRQSHSETGPNDYVGQPTAAEVVAFGNTNDPTECGGGGVRYYGTPDFGTVTFTQIKVTDSTQTGSQAMNNPAFTLQKDVMYGPLTGAVDAQPGTLHNDTTAKPYQSSFAATWLRPE